MDAAAPAPEKPDLPRDIIEALESLQRLIRRYNHLTPEEGLVAARAILKETDVEATIELIDSFERPPEEKPRGRTRAPGPGGPRGRGPRRPREGGPREGGHRRERPEGGAGEPEKPTEGGEGEAKPAEGGDAEPTKPSEGSEAAAPAESEPTEKPTETVDAAPAEKEEAAKPAEVVSEPAPESSAKEGGDEEKPSE